MRYTVEERVYPGGLTCSGHPLACASAVASIGIMREEGMIEHARRLGTEVIGPALAELADTVHRGRIKRLALERVDGEAVVGSDWEPTLLDLGFRSGTSKLTLTA